MIPASLRLRSSVILLISGTLLVALSLVGSGILTFYISRIYDESRQQATRSVLEMAGRVEDALQDMEAHVMLAGSIYKKLPSADLSHFLELSEQSGLDALYIIDDDGKLVSVNMSGSSATRSNELIGVDLSMYPLFQKVNLADSIVWSDKHISTVTGAVTIGFGLPVREIPGVAIGEVSLSTLISISRVARGNGDIDYWIIDKRGEVVADTVPGNKENANLLSLPIVSAGFSGSKLPETIDYRGKNYIASTVFSEKLGWLFVSRIPTGLDHPRIQEIVTIVFLIFIGSVVVGLLLAPVWAQSIVRPLKAVANRANQIAHGSAPEAWPKGGIIEVNELHSDLESMAEDILNRENELRALNTELEQRVKLRTTALQKSNDDLYAALRTLQQAKEELIESEKLAALGRLVAGFSHELATPLGNGRLAISSLSNRFVDFKSKIDTGIKRSDLNDFFLSFEKSMEITEANLNRAGKLISTFKQVAADRTGSRRRNFELNEIIDEVILTTSPAIKNLPIEISTDLRANISLNSFPGELGQAMTNLITNCILHAFEPDAGGKITISSHVEDDAIAVIRLCDDGIGMDMETRRKIFEPFYTTKLGQGGTGLGLFITRNAITSLLGGTITVTSAKGSGTCFEIRIPIVAPEPLQPDAESDSVLGN